MFAVCDAPFAGGQHEREVRVAGLGLVGKSRQLLEELGDRQGGLPVRVGDSLPRLVVVVDGEHDPRLLLEDRVEECLAEREPFALEAGAPH